MMTYSCVSLLNYMMKILADNIFDIILIDFLLVTHLKLQVLRGDCTQPVDGRDELRQTV